MASICGAPVCAGGKPQLKFTYTGDYVVRKDGVVELLTSGTIVFLEPKVIDVFMVGGGAAGYAGNIVGGANRGYGGGGGGYTITRRSVQVSDSYNIVVGAGGQYSIGQPVNGGNTSWGNLFAVEGGKASTQDVNGGAGGSGGGGGVISNSDYGAGGSDGGNGENGYGVNTAGGQGQGFTTREFGEATGKLYAGGGGGGRYMSAQSAIVSPGGAGGGGSGAWDCSSTLHQVAAAGVANTGGGGGGGAHRNENYAPTRGASGGSGIVCFRDAAELPELAGTWVLNERLYAPENDFDEITGYRFKVGTIECTRIRTSNLTHLSAFKVFSGDTVDIYTFSTNTWNTTARNLTFPAGATASDEFRAWLASNASKQA